MADKKYYITKEKLQELKKECEKLLELERLKTKKDVPKILESEDVNPEYFAFQEDLNLLQNRLKELKDILENYELIKIPPKEERSVVGLGARVAVQIDGEKDEFTIVGTLEANPFLGRISNESPVGKVLIGKKEGDQFVVSSPIKVTYKVLKIRYTS